MRLRTVTTAIVAVGSILAVSACSGGDGSGDGGEGDSFKIGISQLVQHPALDASSAGFKKAFDDAGVEVEWDEQNAQGEQANATSIAQNFANEDLDLVLAVATPAAQAAAQAITNIPVLFTAVTDAQEAGLVDTNDSPGGNVTGTSDLNPVAEQLQLVKDLKSDAKTVGIVYSSGEVNSQVQVDLAKEAAKDLGVEIKEATIANSGELAQAVDSLGKVDAYYVPTDNNVVSAVSTMVQAAEKNKALLVGSEAGQVEQGAAITRGIDYTKLGEQTGQMALKILQDGQKPAELPVETSSDLELVVNPKAAEAQGVEIPQDIIDEADNVIE
ncbi:MULTISPECIES: ABC transporter substrate-binding protein [unclassified Brevibacterium]|uniref:ABC transporter substrate-binding protein n=1 Tax=unclassified Brevibacterium TaxID=2614124 RepID=UPI001E428289|nr:MULTISPECIES: ABC transporter substrate-binding protein [unclassified Brevibacterium]MCD1287503.1 sugar ABC transporter substrate-binding protein [Brevibacterium sp. CCUG 69071]MDK8436690.1 ABC transporter substrate-binding protein [Brevibacterium sp. H-BE7]